MKIEEVEIISVKTDKLFTHPHHYDKKWQTIARVWINTNGIEIMCNLIRGIDKVKETPFYFFELPCFRFKDKDQKWRKVNLVNFKQQDSIDFQNKAFALFIQQRPDLFREDLINYNTIEEQKKEKNDG